MEYSVLLGNLGVFGEFRESQGWNRKDLDESMIIYEQSRHWN
jgi:hypothetical protein